MATRVILHIGAMKSGTSFIQNVLAANRDELGTNGVLFPGKGWRAQVRAVRDVIEHDPEDLLDRDGPWRELVEEIKAWDGVAIVSMEFLGPRSPAQIQIMSEAFAGSDLQVVLTGRDLARTIPAMWQESVQNAAVATWPDFLAAVQQEDTKQPGPGRWFWKHQRLALMTRRWTQVVGRDHFSFITVPPSGAPPSLLWERFAEVAGLDPTAYRLDVRSNPSIGAASAMVLRELNVALADENVPHHLYDRFVKRALAKQGLAGRSRQEPSLGVVDAAWVHERARLEVKRLAGQNVRVVGDLAELIPATVSGDTGAASPEIAVEDQLAAAVDALALTVRMLVAQADAVAGQPSPTTATEGVAR